MFFRKKKPCYFPEVVIAGGEFISRMMGYSCAPVYIGEIPQIYEHIRKHALEADSFPKSSWLIKPVSIIDTDPKKWQEYVKYEVTLFSIWFIDGDKAVPVTRIATSELGISICLKD